MRKLLLLILVTGFATALIWVALKKPAPRPSVKLADGSTLVLRGVTFGTNHVLGTRFAKAVSMLPLQARRPVEGVFGEHAHLQTSTTSEPTLKVWVSRASPPGGQQPTNSLNCKAVLADSAGFVAGPDYGFTPDSLVTLDFTAFPRRAEFLLIRILQSADGQNYTECGSYRIRNPLTAAYPTWAPNAHTLIQTNGDLRVELKRLLTGISDSPTYSATGLTWHTSKPGAPTYAAVETKIVGLEGGAEDWEVTGATVSDATGNVVNHSLLSTFRDWGFTAFSPALWPSESAWKLKLQFKRRDGYAPTELFAFADAPLPAPGGTNVLGWSTNVNGCRVSLVEVCRRQPNESNAWTSRDSSYVKVMHSPLPPDLYLDLAEIWFDEQRANHGGWSSRGNMRDYWLRSIPAEVKSMRVVFAVHQGRTVEFIAKPEKLDSHGLAGQATPDRL